MAPEKRIKEEIATDSQLYCSAGAPDHVIMTSSKVSPPTRLRGAQSGGTLSLPVTISKDFIKELVVSRALEKTGGDGRRIADDDSAVPDAASATPAIQTSQL